MDRQAWIAVTLCVLGLIAWQFYMTSHALPPLPVPSPTPAAQLREATATPGAPVEEPSAPINPSGSTEARPPVDQPSPTPAPVSFAERTETLRNSDLELLLTNRGGGIKEATLPGHTVESGANVRLNPGSDIPIGAILEKPSSPVLNEFAISRQSDGSVQFERALPDQVTLHKKFSLPPSPNKKESYIAQLEISFKNDGARPYVNPGYFIALGSAGPIHEKDWPTFTRITWCVGGTAKYTDVSWFAEQNKFFGLQKRPAQEFYSAKVNGAEWTGVSNQFFATLLPRSTPKRPRFGRSDWKSSPLPLHRHRAFLRSKARWGCPGFNCNLTRLQR